MLLVAAMLLASLPLCAQEKEAPKKAEKPVRAQGKARKAG